MKSSESIAMDESGRLVLPKRLREAAGIAPGQPLRASLTGDGRIELEILPAPARVERRGRWRVVVPPEGAPPLTEAAVETLRRQMREPRHGR